MVSLNTTMAFLFRLKEAYYFDKQLISWQLISSGKLFPVDLTTVTESNVQHSYECSTIRKTNVEKVGHSQDVWVVIAGKEQRS